MQLVSTLKRTLAITAVMGSLVLPSNSRAQTEPPSEPPVEWTATSIDYSNVHYPWPGEYFDVELFGLDLRMAYMDVEPTGLPNGQTVIVFHGMNFVAGPYEPLIRALTEEGIRAIESDRWGSGRSSNPDRHFDQVRGFTRVSNFGAWAHMGPGPSRGSYLIYGHLVS